MNKLQSFIMRLDLREVYCIDQHHDRPIIVLYLSNQYFPEIGTQAFGVTLPI